VEPAKVQHIRIDQIGPNPHNPRRLFDEEPMQILRESVKKLGILVPVTLYEAPTNHKPRSEKYILLDGERRWRCVKDLGIDDKVPAIIVDRPSETQNILTMFHIHNVREGWQLMPTALKLKTLIDELQETNERKLSELTKLSVSQIRRCKILLTYPKKFQEMMLAPPSERMKADFFIELDRIRRPALDDRFGPWREVGDSACIQGMLNKYESGTIKAVTDFRQLAEIYKASRSSRKHKKLVTEFQHFLKHPDMRIEDINVPGATFAREAKEIHRSAQRLLAQVNSVEVDIIASDLKLIGTLRRLVKILSEKLESGLLVGVRDEADRQDSR
jgi:ParB/RepB/Spo0J family partition protein